LASTSAGTIVPAAAFFEAMLDSLGLNILRQRSVGDDTCTGYERIDGDQHSATICCLPWRMPYRLAQATRLVPRHFLACYEMPRAIVSSEPELCVRAVNAVVDDAASLIARKRLAPEQVLIVGLSIGNAVATVLANRIGARLCSIASADRGDLTLWESPASLLVKELAESKGYRIEDFTHALAGLHTVENLGNLAPGSRFIFGHKDELIPKARREGLIAAVRRQLPEAEISHLDAGHFGTMSETVRRGFDDDLDIQLASA
jgi:pimeloyl-ACP methyl ester carboxylesterase